MKIESFDADKLYDVINTYVEGDEVERALWILDNLPGYYRDFPPDNLKKLKQDILASLVTARAYSIGSMDTAIVPENATFFIENLLRGQLIWREVDRWNDEDKMPHIVDMGPGEYLVPIGLKQKNLSFTYDPIWMDKKAHDAAVPMIEDVLWDWDVVGRQRLDPPRTIFLALEVIEHLPSTQDIVIEAHRHCGGWPARVHLSTPMYTYDGRRKDWNKSCGLPHLRTYTPREFIAEAQRLFPGYVLQYYPGELMSIRLLHPGYPDPHFLVDLKDSGGSQ